MTAPALARGRTGRWYQWPPGPKPDLNVPSVTTILKQLSKGDVLTNWAAKSVAQFAVENILSWQDLPSEAAVDMLKRSPYRMMTRARDLGSAIHAAIESWQGGEPVVDDLDLLPHVGAAISFMEDHVETALEYEETVFNRTYQYAGTFDLIAKLKDGRTAICDWKSGKALYPEVALQLVAYSNGEFIGDPDGTTRDLPPIDLGIAVHLPGDSTYTAREIELTPRLWRTFQALRTVQLWKDDFEADALGKSHKGPKGVKPTPIPEPPSTIESDLDTVRIHQSVRAVMENAAKSHKGPKK